MNWFAGIVVYLITYWTVLFTVLPWGNRAPEIPEDGQSGGAPVDPHIRRKFLVTGLIAAAIWIVIYCLVVNNIIDFRGIARDMMDQDLQQ